VERRIVQGVPPSLSTATGFALFGYTDTPRCR
jgi:hypothetical protein